MPVQKKEVELDDGTMILCRQVSGLERLELESRQARVFRSLRDFGSNPAEWTEEQQEEFAMKMDEADCGPAAQMRDWVPLCILDESVDANELTSSELQTILRFIRGDEEEGAVPLLSS